MPAIPTLNHMQKLMPTDFENEDICLYGCASCGIMVIEARDFDMETRGKFLKNCSQYILTLDEEDDYNLWSPLKRESNNTIVIENSKLMMLHLKYIRPYDPTSTCVTNSLRFDTSTAYFCKSCYISKGRPLFSLFYVNFGVLAEYIMPAVRALSYLEYLLLCPVRLYTLLVKLKYASGILRTYNIYLYMCECMYIYIYVCMYNIYI